MVEHLLPAAFAMLLWWAGTGVILVLDGLRRGFQWTARRNAAAGRWPVWPSRARRVSARLHYIAFTCAILVWAWIEVTFLTGMLATPEPRRRARATGARSGRRSRRSCGTARHLAGAATRSSDRQRTEFSRPLDLPHAGRMRLGASASSSAYAGERCCRPPALYRATCGAPDECAVPFSIIAGVALWSRWSRLPGSADAGTIAGYTLLAASPAGVLNMLSWYCHFREALWRGLLPSGRGGAPSSNKGAWPATLLPNGDHRDRCGVMTKTDAPPPHGSRT